MRPDLSKITSPSVRTLVKANPYRPYGRPSMDVENLLLETALQTDVFYYLCDTLLRPPTQDEFVKRYLNVCKSEISRKGCAPEDVGKRIARAWATYVMELDFYCQIRDSGLFDQVIMDTEVDAAKGCNLEAVYKGERYYVALYFETPWAVKWLADKARRKAGLALPLRFPLKEGEADFTGRVHFYTSKHIGKLRQLFAITAP